jgi:glycosyltransferase involved in cell wall biosynthesis
MMNIIRLADNLRWRKDAHFLLVGDGDEVDLVKGEIFARKLDNITYHPGVPPRDYFGIMEEVDIGLFSLHRRHGTHNIPGKLLGYMQFGIPILGSVNVGNDIREIIEEPEAGLISVNGDDEAFKTNAMMLLENRKLRERMGKNAKQLLTEYFSVEKASKQVMEIKRKTKGGFVYERTLREVFWKGF